jgi:H+-translocating NAD(P) transhydrogenase subunit alpha
VAVIGVLREARPGETRVAATPATVSLLQRLGHDVVVEPGAGDGSSFTDDAYAAAGATTGDPAAADLVVGVRSPSPAQLDRLRPGTTLVALLAPATSPDLVADLARRRLTALAMDAVPRISRAQSLDALSSMANIAGYRAVVEAAHAFGRFFTGQVTAAGTVPPATVLVAGAGVAGLAAIGTAGALGAVVRATDPRPEVADQVRSLGGQYLPVAATVETTTTGYANQVDADYQAREAALYAAQCREVDVVITTALVPGRPAPRLLTAEMVASMRPGSVVVDMATASGGNVEGSVPDDVVVTANGVTVIGYTDLTARLPAQASQLYGTNVANLVQLLTPARDGRIVLDLDDVVVRAMTVVHDGGTLWPPPPVAVSAAPPAPAAPPEPVPESPVRTPLSPRRRLALVAVGALALFGVAAVAPPTQLGHLTVFALAVVVGFYVIGHVHHALHTPLLSVTNAISGIIVVGALLQLWSASPVVTVLAAVAVLVASINVFGGFAVTRRMLAMFVRS